MRGVNPGRPGTWLLGGTLATSLGGGMQTLAAGKLLYDETGSIAAFGVVLIVEQLLTFTVPLVAGPWVDRGDPRRICTAIELARGTALIAIGCVMLSGPSPLGWIMAMSLCIKAGQPFYRGAMFSMAPAAVPGAALGTFNAYSNIAQQGGALLGAAVAGVIIQGWGAPACFLVTGAGFLLSGLAIAAARIPRPEAEPAAGKGASAGWGPVVALLRTERGFARHLLLGTADNIAVVLFNLLLFALVARHFGGSAYWLSAMDCAFAVGAICAAPALGPLEARLGPKGAVRAGLAGQALCFAALAAGPGGPVVIGLALALGACNTVSWTTVTTALQLRAGKAVRGRIGTARNLVTAGVSAALVPVVSRLEQRSPGFALLAGAVVIAAYVLLAGAVAGDRETPGEDSAARQDGTTRNETSGDEKEVTAT
ncbi:MFS transporter [Streptomyces rectiverticillatus]|uniref:MFS transporter n=1 Tax=Streptomyces rectiverticillatus TaxID=173860 RepID=UPI0015C33958|nr:MFS transporter [Streptomyces rectiverticillatus]QLE70741.1 MFS transporter [Streptomyces rectiverticillatus]